MTLAVRAARPEDAEALNAMRCALWPADPAVHRRELEAFFEGVSHPAIEILVASDAGGTLLGFCELSIRSYAEGCSSDRVGYLEGWYVLPDSRRRGVGRALLDAAEAWARAQGCVEFASDAEADNESSARVHRAVGFDEVGLIRCFCKKL